MPSCAFLEKARGHCQESAAEAMEKGAGIRPPQFCLFRYLLLPAQSAVDDGVLVRPAIDEGLFNLAPVSLTHGVGGQSGDNGSSPSINVRSVVERPGNRGLTISQQSVAVVDELVAGSGAVLEGNRAELLDINLGSVGIGNQPDKEVDGSLLIFFRSLGVDGPAVLGAGAQSCLGVVVRAAVDGDHLQVVGVHLEVAVSAGQVGEFPSAVLEEDSLAGAELRTGLVAGLGGQLRGSAGGVVDVQIPNVLEEVQVLAGDGGDIVRDALIMQGQGCEVAGESPGRGAFQTCGGEGVEAQLGGAGMDVLCDLLQGSKVLDILNLVAGLFQQSLVDDDAEGLVAVADGLQLALCIVEVEGVGVELLGDGAVGQIKCVFIPVIQGGGVADVEDGDVADVGGQGVVVVAGSSGDDLNFDAGLFGVGCGQLGQSFIKLRLEVQVVNGTLRGIGVVFGRGWTRKRARRNYWA